MVSVVHEYIGGTRDSCIVSCAAGVLGICVCEMCMCLTLAV